MDDDLKSLLAEKLKLVSKTYQLGLTDQAATIPGECLAAIKIAVDSRAALHGSWPPPIRRNPGPFQLCIMDALPTALVKFAQEARLAVISSFDLLHGMSGIVDFLCPFRKGSEAAMPRQSARP